MTNVQLWVILLWVKDYATNEKVLNYFYLGSFSVSLWVSHPSPCKFADWDDGYKNREKSLHIKSWPILI